MPQGASQGQLLGPLVEVDLKSFAARPTVGNKEAELLGAQEESEIQSGIELPSDASASQWGTEQDPFWAGFVQLSAGLYSPG